MLLVGNCTPYKKFTADFGGVSREEAPTALSNYAIVHLFHALAHGCLKINFCIILQFSVAFYFSAKNP